MYDACTGCGDWSGESGSHWHVLALVDNLLVSGANSTDRQHSEDVEVTNEDANDIGDKFRTDVPIRELSWENFDSVEIFDKLSQVTKGTHPLRSVNDDHREKLVVSFHFNRYDYSNSLWTIYPRAEDLSANLNLETLTSQTPTSFFMVFNGEARVALVDFHHRSVSV